MGRNTSLLPCVVAACWLLAAAGCADTPTDPAALPPGQPVPLVNASFNADGQGRLAGWLASEHNTGNSYTFMADTQQARSQPSSARIQRYGQEIFGLLEQEVRVKPEWIGKTARLSGHLKSAGVSGTGGALVLQARLGGGAILVHNHMDDRRVRGDTPWTLYTVEIKLPPNAWSLRVGVLLEDGGTLWADDLALDIMD